MTTEQIPALNDSIYDTSLNWHRIISFYERDIMRPDEQLLAIERKVEGQLVGTRNRLLVIDSKLGEYADLWERVPGPDMFCAAISALSGGRYKTCQERQRARIEKEFDFALERRAFLLDELDIAERSMERINGVYRGLRQ